MIYYQMCLHLKLPKRY
uniref:Uncharacterized protein n=1 Tax=Romanomermis culicivorax TaxID=13658 RepID=A0A915HHI8_ROMCU